MGLRALISAALKAAVALVLVPVEMIVDGIRVVRRFLGIAPAAPAFAMADAAEEVLSESDGGIAAQDADLATARRAGLRLSPSERVRRAAGYVRKGQGVPRAYLDPSDEDQAEVLEWLRSLDEVQLGRVIAAGDRDLLGHLSGVQKLPVPLLPRFQEIVEEKKNGGRPLSYEQWVRFLSAQAAEAGDDDVDVDRILDEAERLSAEHATLDDYKTANPGVGLGGVSDDGEEAA
ncbi:hypothetical protein GCM10011390_02620 [Aureimonas endophytica]|uniref:Uncharacterized protein n=1 Tax=Aureimonas endophytica TaxID=2027858 RepID=A0A917E009_9HYPH|nr:hypothetical protein [Aureimonas endophytica]GGD87377.1 hypothetical protein GCM10011390_02620 [Aureimonas endophytica]